MERLDVAFAHRLEEDPEAVALVVDGASWTRREVARRSDGVAAALEDAGGGVGDVVVAQYATDVEDLALALACSRLGRTLVPIPASLGGYELSYVLELTGSRVLVLRGDAPEGTQIPSGVTVRTGAELVAHPPRATERRPIGPDHICVVGLTAGSTGRPKGVMHRWPALAYAAEQARALVGVQGGEPIGMAGAGAGAPGYAFVTYLGLTGGQAIVRSSHWDPPGLLGLLARHRCVWMMTVPTVLQMLVTAAEEAEGPVDLSALRGISLGGSYISPELIRRARKVLGVEVLRMFGLSECLGHAAMRLDDPEPDRDRYDGRPFPGTDVVAVDDEGRPVPVGEVGEVAVKGPSLMVGYLGQPSPDAHLTPDGRFRTGDLIRLSPEGYVEVVGRKKDMIIRGGFNLDPAEIEELVGRHPDVVQVAVVAYPDERLGERACAVVTTRGNRELTLEELVAFLASHGFSKTKFPERVEVRGSLPLSPDGKVLKAQLRTELTAT